MLLVCTPPSSLNVLEYFVLHFGNDYGRIYVLYFMKFSTSKWWPLNTAQDWTLLGDLV